MDKIYWQSNTEPDPHKDFIREVRLLGEDVPLVSESDKHVCKWWFLGEITMNEARKFLGFREIDGGDVYRTDR